MDIYNTDLWRMGVSGPGQGEDLSYVSLKWSLLICLTIPPLGYRNRLTWCAIIFAFYIVFLFKQVPILQLSLIHLYILYSGVELREEAVRAGVGYSTFVHPLGKFKENFHSLSIAEEAGIPHCGPGNIWKNPTYCTTVMWQVRNELSKGPFFPNILKKDYL